jgi:outer membrane protein assembly factor BamB
MFRSCPWCVSFLVLATLAGHAVSENASPSDRFDWPQWRGPNRDATSPETGLLKQWPKEGPPLAWKAKRLGRAYSSVSVAGGRVFTMGDRQGAEYVIALDAATGKELWASRVGEPWKGEGPRCTPTVDGDLLYALSPHGDLVCLETAGGTERWRKSLPRDFDGRMMSGWGYSESPLVDGDRLIVTPGGKAATLVALDKKTGETVWKSPVPGGDGAAYASAIAADLDGRREYVQFLGRGVVGVDAADGKFLWRYDKPANGTANTVTPLYHDHCVFAASAYGRGGGLVRLPAANASGKPQELYFTKQMKNHHGGVVLVDGCLYGANGGNGEQRIYALVCLDFKTGDVKWESREAGKGSLAYADGRLYYRNENGPMLLVEANPKRYVERGRFTPPDCTKHNVWAHPVIANGRLYLRDQDVLLSYDIKIKQH